MEQKGGRASVQLILPKLWIKAPFGHYCAAVIIIRKELREGTLHSLFFNLPLCVVHRYYLKRWTLENIFVMRIMPPTAPQIQLLASLGAIKTIFNSSSKHYFNCSIYLAILYYPFFTSFCVQYKNHSKYYNFNPFLIKLWLIREILTFYSLICKLN